MKTLNRTYLIGMTFLISATGTVQADRVVDGNLNLNIDRTELNKIGNTIGVSTYIERYFDQPTANLLTAPQLITEQLDGLVEPETNLDFAANGKTVVHPIDPSIPNNAQHFLQPTNFAFTDANDIAGSSTGQIGFGGILRLGFGDLTQANPDLGQGNIAIGDFTLSYNPDRITNGATGASGWLIQTTTGIPNPNHPLRNLFDITNETIIANDNTLSITGSLLWTPEIIGNFFTDAPSINAGSFTANATTVVPLPAAVWFFASGLMTLLGVSRSKKSAIATA